MKTAASAPHMEGMNMHSSAAAPYSVFVEIPRYVIYLLSGRGSVPFVDTGLRPGQLEGFDLHGSKVKFVLAAFLSSALTWIFSLAIFAVPLLPALATGDMTGLAIVVACAVAWAGAIGWGTRYMRRRGEVADAAIGELKQQRALASVPEDERFKDLRRISRAIRGLQAEHGSSYDDQAREAVVAVMEQNQHRPDEKHLTIAHSDATDVRSSAIRKKTLEADAAWRRDVANAEQLILVLEEAAGLRTAVTL